MLPDKLGGVFSFVQDLLRARRPDGFRYDAIRTANLNDEDTRAAEATGADREFIVEHRLPLENVYAVLRRLERAIGPDPGVLFANGWLELALAHWHDTGRAVVQMVHGDFDYYYNLATMHEPVIDAFVTYTRQVDERLRALLPHRQQDIHLMRYGVPIPPAPRTPAAGPLRVLYLGRLHHDKGVLELPEMDRLLRASGVEVRWTIHGDGPAREQLRAAWPDTAHVTWSTPAPIDAVRRLYATHDVFVLPARFEALPVALLEAGAAGVVPVVSDLPSGIPEVVEDGATGYRIPVGDVAGFADALRRLAADRRLVEQLSAAVRAHVASRFDVVTNTAAYQALFASWRTLRRPRPSGLVLPYGSRLDRPWLPNGMVRAVRTGLRALR
ncbi:MAG: glycosyltransferase family 4 protein [Vicinamibacterales bacterium]